MVPLWLYSAPQCSNTTAAALLLVDERRPYPRTPSERLLSFGVCAGTANSEQLSWQQKLFPVRVANY